MSAPSPMFAVEERDGVVVLRMSHGKVSALDPEFCAAMAGELDRLAAAGASPLVLTGTGAAFSAGVDLFRVLEGGADYIPRFVPELERLFRSLLLFPQPVVAAVNGHAIAGGCIMAAAADYRLMARGAGRIGVPEVVVGVPFPPMPFEIIAARLSPALLRTLVYTGRTVEADEAVTMGFVDEATDADRLLERAIEVAQRLGAIPPQTFALTKRAFTMPIIERVNAADSREVVAAWRSEDVHDAIRRYLERTIKKKG